VHIVTLKYERSIWLNEHWAHGLWWGQWCLVE